MHTHRPGVHPRPAARLSEWGASLVEYALLLGLITIACIGALTYFGSSSQTSVKHSTDCIITAGTATPVCP